MLNKVLRSKEFNVLYIIFVSSISALCLKNYSGSWQIFLLFTLSFNYLVLTTLNNQKSFFAFYLAVLLWLGFWFKTVISLIFFNGHFIVPVGNFDYSPSAFDKSFVVSTIGAFGFIIAFKVIDIYKKKDSTQFVESLELLGWYKKYKIALWASFVILVLIIAFSNVYLGIYQRGLSSQTHLPFGLNGIYKWLLLFGLTSFSAWLLYNDISCTKKLSVPLVLLALSEIYISGISLLSRAMILTALAYCLGVGICVQYKKIKVPFYKVISIILFIVLGFATSLYITQKIRVHVYYNKFHNQEISHKRLNSIILQDSFGVLVNRWVGIEGVMAISSYKGLGLPLLKKAGQEEYKDYGGSFFDDNILNVNYLKPGMKQWHYITLPGVIAFSFYAGSYGLVFLMMFCLGLAGVALESTIFYISKRNAILTSIFSLVFAYRLVHFGYVPKQSYLLLGAMVANLLLIYFLNQRFTCGQNQKKNKLVLTELPGG